MGCSPTWPRQLGVALVPVLMVLAPLGSATRVGASAAGWSVVPTPPTSALSGLSAASCISASDCWAVGDSGSAGEHWNGTRWSPVTLAAPGSAVLSAVTCTSRSNCWAVGRTANGTLAERWNGTDWSSVPTPGGASEPSALFGVSCVTDSSCWAVGSYFTAADPPATQTLAEHWDGSAWAVEKMPHLATGGYNFLNAVACRSGSDCWATGDSANYHRTLAEHWNGEAWSVVATPDTTSSGNVLNGLACSSSSDCWATGQGAGKALAERWNGSVWSIVATPDPSSGVSGFAGGSSELGGSSVQCVSASNCWAVGFADRQQTTLVLVEHWNGTAWSVVPSADPGGSHASELASVACSPDGRCQAVGYSVRGGASHTLAEASPAPR